MRHAAQRSDINLNIMKKKTFNTILILTLLCFCNNYAQEKKNITEELIIEFQQACISNNLEKVKLILSETPEIINSRNEEQKTALFLASGKANFEVCKFLIEKGANIEAESNSLTPIWEAVGSGNLDIVKLLVESGADYDTQGKSRVTSAFLRSIMKGQIETVKYFLSKGAKTSAISLGFAMSRNHPEIFEILIQENFDINLPDDYDGTTLLHKSVKSGDIFYFDLILKKHADLNIKDSIFGRTALHEAVLRGQTLLAKKLIDNGSELYNKDNLGFTALDYAERQGNIELIDYTKGKNTQNKYLPISTRISVTEEKEAVIWHLQNFGWAIKTKNHFFIINYFYNLTGKEIEPEFKSIFNGWINDEEIKNENIILITTANAYKSYDKVIYELAKSCNNIKYVFCSKPNDLDNYDVDYEIISDSLIIGDVQFYNIDADIKEVGHFILRADNLTIYYQNEFTNRDLGKYKLGIEKVGLKFNQPDLAFLNAHNHHLFFPQNRTHELNETFLFSIEEINPRIVFPMDQIVPVSFINGFDNIEKSKIILAGNGDMFVYKNGKIINDKIDYYIRK